MIKVCANRNRRASVAQHLAKHAPMFGTIGSTALVRHSLPIVPQIIEGVRKPKNNVQLDTAHAKLKLVTKQTEQNGRQKLRIVAWVRIVRAGCQMWTQNVEAFFFSLLFSTMNANRVWGTFRAKQATGIGQTPKLCLTAAASYTCRRPSIACTACTGKACDTVSPFFWGWFGSSRFLKDR